MKVAAIQHDISWEERDENFLHISPLIAKASGEGAELAVLSEMFSTGFSMNTALVAERPEGPSASFLHEEASRHGIVVAGTFPCRYDESHRPVNRFYFARPDGTSSFYDKIHPFGHGGEAEHYEGGTASKNIEIGGLSISPFVCYDLRFADCFYDRARVTDCYVVAANWPSARVAHWTTLLRARAIENLAYVIGVNRVGVGNKVAYSGESLAIDPFGEILARAADGEEVFVVDATHERVDRIRTKYRFLEDR